jgi:hypothetical protein
MLFCTISAYWSWGYGKNAELGVSASGSLGPWVAGQIWSTYPVPCNCQNGYCYNYCYVASKPVEWLQLNADNACGPTSQVYREWSGPLGYCKFPAGFPIPPFNGGGNVTEPPLPENTTGKNTEGLPPVGTSFVIPTEASAMQALLIISTIFVFFAAIAGCADSISESSTHHKALSLTATVSSFIAFTFALAAYVQWTYFPYVQKLQANPPTITMPVWNENLSMLWAVKAQDVFWGPGFATAITASILTFFALVIHALSVAGGPQQDGESDAPKSPAKAEAAPQAAAASPEAPAATPVDVSAV